MSLLRIMTIRPCVSNSTAPQEAPGQSSFTGTCLRIQKTQSRPNCDWSSALIQMGNRTTSVLKSSSTAWANSGVAEVANWRFRPAVLNGQPIAAKATLELETGASGGSGTNRPAPDPNWQPGTADEFLARGYARLRAHKYPQAEADAVDALKLMPDAVTAWFLKGRAAYDDKEYSTALEAFEKVLSQRADWAEAYRYRGLAYSHSGQHERGVADYQKAIELDPDYGAAYNDLGWAYTELGQLDLAKANLDKALALEPNLISARENRAKLLARQGDFGAEQNELNIILGLAPNNQWAKDTIEAVRQKLNGDAANLK